MSVDRRLHFLRVDLQSSYVDDAAPSTEEVVPVAAAFHHVTGVDEAVIVGDRGMLFAGEANRVARGTDSQRTLGDVDLHVAGCADHGRRKPLETIVDLKSHAGFR